MDGPDAEQNVLLALEFCLAHPRWRLSLQTHKFLQDSAGQGGIVAPGIFRLAPVVAELSS